jgi:hypothetical protein
MTTVLVTPEKVSYIPGHSLWCHVERSETSLVYFGLASIQN